MLKTTADETPGNWPQRLPIVMATYRMTVHKTTGVTPNMAILGREVMLPATLIAKPPEELVKTTVGFVTCAPPISVYERPYNDQREHRKCTMISGPGHLILKLANMFGCFGRDLRFASVIINSSGYGRAPG